MPSTEPVAWGRRFLLGTYVALWAVELSAVVLALAVPRIISLTHLATVPGVSALLAAVTAAIAGSYVVHRITGHGRTARSVTGFTIMLNLISLAAILATTEGALRAIAERTPYGVVIAGIPLLPRSWDDEVSRNAAILRRAATDGSYLVADDVTGWTVGPSRTSADGLSFSSVEGLRSPRPGVALAAARPKRRIALVGDSATFCLEVRYEECWGHELERSLGPDVQVLNFGVPGYGVDQAYLRYLHEVRPWRPDVVIFGVFPHDLVRTLVIYPFIAFPEWEYPFSKPRFVVQDGELKRLNAPAMRPDVIFRQRVVTDLPFLAYDWGYDPSRWRWTPADHLYALRLLASIRPSTPRPRDETSENAIREINSALLRAFARSAREAGTRPLIVYLPARLDVDPRLVTPQRSTASVHRTLAASGVPYTNLTSCVRAVDPERRFVPSGRHYSPEGNAAVARCLLPVVQAELARGPAPGADDPSVTNR